MSKGHSWQYIHYAFQYPFSGSPDVSLTSSVRQQLELYKHALVCVSLAFVFVMLFYVYFTLKVSSIVPARSTGILILH